LQCAFGVVGKIVMSRFFSEEIQVIEEILGKVWIQNVGDIDFKVISATDNSNKFQKTRFWEEKSLEDVLTLGPMAQATLVIK